MSEEQEWQSQRQQILANRQCSGYCGYVTSECIFRKTEKGVHSGYGSIKLAGRNCNGVSHCIGIFPDAIPKEPSRRVREKARRSGILMKLKRLISAIVALALVLSMSVSAFAATGIWKTETLPYPPMRTVRAYSRAAITPRTARLLFHSGIAPRQRAAPSPYPRLAVQRQTSPSRT